MKNILLVFFFIVCASKVSYGQLSGTYTIGGTSPNYATITQARIALYSQGISGPVVFNIRPGTYSDYLSFSSIGGLSAVNTITLQSETLDSSSVIISTCPTCWHVFTEANHAVFNELTIIDSIYNAFYDPRNITIKNCVITSPVNSQMNFFYGTDTIINSVLTGEISGSATMFFNNNTLTGDLGISHMTCLNSTIIGNVSTGNNSLYDHNEIYGHLSSGPGGVVCTMKNNLIIDTSSSGSGVSINGSDKQFYNNEVHAKASFTFATYCKIKGNKFFDDVSLGGTINYQVINNFFYKNLNAWQCDYSNFYSNNFSRDSGQYFWLGGQHNQVKNNILPLDFQYYDTVATVVDNNDYPPLGGMYDSHPWYIDPQYVSATDLHAQNIQLIGKGKPSISVLYDIDSVLRPNPPTIGANEICISIDSINIFCGDSIRISFCNVPTNGNYLWQPGTGLNDSISARPLASPQLNTLYILTDSLSGFTDSVFINVIPFQVHANSDTLIQCGSSALLNATYNAGATYQWTPSVGLSSTDSFHTIASPSQTTTYMVMALDSVCGNSQDSVTVFVDPLPVAIIYISIANQNYFAFNNASTCADTYLWDWGDGTFSSDTNGSHLYLTTGVFTVTMIACNAFGCDTVTQMVNVFSISSVFSPAQNSPYHLTINPNPNNGDFDLCNTLPKSAQYTIYIYDLEGREIFKNQILMQNGSAHLNLSQIPNGCYILKIITEDDMVYTIRLIILR